MSAYFLVICYSNHGTSCIYYNRFFCCCYFCYYRNRFGCFLQSRNHFFRCFRKIFRTCPYKGRDTPNCQMCFFFLYSCTYLSPSHLFGTILSHYHFMKGVTKYYKLQQKFYFIYLHICFGCKAKVMVTLHNGNVSFHYSYAAVCSLGNKGAIASSINA